MHTLVTPTKGMGYSDIYLDFLAGEESARKFYQVGSIDDAARRIDCRSCQREAVASILARQNRAYGATPQTLVNIEALENNDTLCVFAGQQAGLFGGPMLTINKALGAIKSARQYADQLKRPVVPIFWIAGDDHDLEEINHTFVLDRAGQPVPIEHDGAPEHPWPVARVTFDDAEAVEKAINGLKEALGETDFTGEVYELIERCYTSSETYVTAFAKLMTALFGECGLVLFSPADDAAKRLAVPFFKSVLDRRDNIHEAFTAANEDILAAGYHLQVEKSENATHLFCDIDGRKPILQDGDAFRIGEERFTREQIDAMLDEKPGRFSPDVITRPILQSFLFPVVVQKGGPAEIAYFAQIGRLFKIFEIDPPFYMARATMTVLENRFAKMVHDYHVEFGELTGDVEQIVNRVLAQTFPVDLEKGFALLRRDIEFHIDSFSEKTLQFAPSLEKFGDQTRGKIDFLIKNFESKVFASHKRKSNETRERIYRLHNAMYPRRGLQERSLNVSYFLSRYGLRFISYLYEQTRSEEKAHQIIDLTELK